MCGWWSVNARNRNDLDAQSEWRVHEGMCSDSARNRASTRPVWGQRTVRNWKNLDIYSKG